MLQYTKSKLKKIVKESYGFTEVSRKLGYVGENSGVKKIKRKVSEWKIDVSHFSPPTREFMMSINSVKRWGKASLLGKLGGD